MLTWLTDDRRALGGRTLGDHDDLSADGGADMSAEEICMIQLLCSTKDDPTKKTTRLKLRGVFAQDEGIDWLEAMRQGFNALQLSSADILQHLGTIAQSSEVVHFILAKALFIVTTEAARGAKLRTVQGVTFLILRGVLW